MTKFSMIFSICAWVLCAIAVSPCNALAQQNQMYQWTDENGVVHFTDTPPEGMNVEARNIPMDNVPTAASPYPGAPSGPSAAQQRRDEISRNAAEGRARQASQDAQCEAWRAEVARLEPNRRVFFTNDQGETERMDDVARTDRVAELKAQIAKNCR